MANQRAIAFGLDFLADGTSTSLTLDLLVDAYFMQNNAPVNWPPTDRKAALPSAINIDGPPDGIPTTATISGSVVTFTFSSAPTAGKSTVSGQLVF